MLSCNDFRVLLPQRARVGSARMACAPARDVASALATLVPRDALAHTFRPRSRAPKPVVAAHTRIDAAEARRSARWVRALDPRSAGTGVRRTPLGAPRCTREPLRDQLAAGTVALQLRTCWLPDDLPWERAHRWPAVLHGASVLDVWAQGSRHHGSWTERLARRSDAGGGDHAVVRCAGRRRGVQVDLSGVVHVTWLVPRSAGTCRPRS